jgi:hypothetical protein
MVESMNIELRWVWRYEPKEKVLQYRTVTSFDVPFRGIEKSDWIDVPVVTEQAENENGNA